MKIKNKGAFWFGAMVVSAFASVLSFFHIDSYVGDKYHFNGLFGFLGVGLLFAGAAVYSLYKVTKNSNSGKAE